MSTEMPEQLFVLLAHPRSGSTHFSVDVLSAHPAVFCFDEIFHEHNYNSRKAMADIGVLPYYLDRKSPSPRYAHELHFLEELTTTTAEKMAKKVIGFKLLLHQVEQSVLMQILNTYKVILLRRQHALQAAVSHTIAMETGQWQFPRKKDYPPFRLDIRQLLEFINQYIKGLDDCERYMQQKQIEYLPLYYESLFTMGTLRSVEAFLSLDVPYPVLDFGRTKLNDRERYQAIENIEEIRATFMRMGFPDLYQEVYPQNMA